MIIILCYCSLNLSEIQSKVKYSQTGGTATGGALNIKSSTGGIKLPTERKNKESNNENRQR